MAEEREAMARPGVLVALVADTKIEGVETLFDRLLDQMLEQQIADTMTAERRIVSWQDVVEALSSDEPSSRQYRRQLP